VIIPELAGFELALLDLQRRLTTRSPNRTVVLRQRKAPATRSSRSPGEKGDSDTPRDDEALAGDSKVS
jgi:hypothetical protein